MDTTSITNAAPRDSSSGRAWTGLFLRYSANIKDVHVRARTSSLSRKGIPRERLFLYCKRQTLLLSSTKETSEAEWRVEMTDGLPRPPAPATTSTKQRKVPSESATRELGRRKGAAVAAFLRGFVPAKITPSNFKNTLCNFRGCCFFPRHEDPERRKLLRHDRRLTLLYNIYESSHGSRPPRTSQSLIVTRCLRQV